MKHHIGFEFLFRTLAFQQISTPIVNLKGFSCKLPGFQLSHENILIVNTPCSECNYAITLRYFV